ncbi:MAG: ATP synthase F1 subunit delta [Candidatus Omnitrophica bacterium]|nr:ATP synthase F1 subunit delta [Candidatus Omnitrophota bacterium]
MNTAMQDEVLAERYACAFLEYAKTTIGFETGLKELQELKRMVRDNEDFRSFLEAPDILLGEKSELIDTTLGKYYSGEVCDFLKLLIRNKRINRFIDIAEYARLEFTHGIEHDAVLKTSYAVETGSLQKIKDSLEKHTGKKLHLYIEMDADLLGGVSTTIGNIVIDGSVKRRLEDLKLKLKTLKVA